MTYPFRLTLALLFAVSSGVVCGATSTDPLTELWEKGVHSFSEGKFEEARSAFSEWNTQAKAAGIESAEAHYDLGISHWQLKEPGPAVFHILKSTRLRLSPFRIWTDLQTLSDLQKKIGVKENLADEWFFRISLLLNTSVCFFLLLVAFWSLCASILIVWVKPKEWVGTRRSLLTLSVALGILVGVAYFNTRYYCRFAVLIGPNETVSVYRSPEIKKEDLLSDFPAGTIVNILHESDTNKNIDAPIAGWIPNENLQVVD